MSSTLDDYTYLDHSKCSMMLIVCVSKAVTVKLFSAGEMYEQKHYTLKTKRKKIELHFEYN